MKAVEVKENSKGIKYAILLDPQNTTYGVWVHKANYNGRVKGGLSYSWRYVQKDLSLDAAQKLFNRRTK